MFAARANQENVVYEQQTAAAAKSLNQGGKGLAPKTPGNKAPKTPFKGVLNNENENNGLGKTGGKGKAAGLFGDSKGGRADVSAFVTPAGPRNRAPLGNKTTNAKATALQTPAPLTQEKPSVRPTSPRFRRAKVKVHQAGAEAEDGDEEREIEYMAPREIPLPDHPDDWPIDRKYPQFEGSNLTRGWFSEFAPQKDDNDDDEFSDFEEKLKKIQNVGHKGFAGQTLKSKPVASSPVMQRTVRDPLTTTAPSTIKSKSAASALTRPSKPTMTPSFAMPTETAKARLPSIVTSRKPTPAPGNPRHTAAKVASNSTLGYSRGRVVSNVRRPLATAHSRQVSLQAGSTQAERTPAKSGGQMLDELFDLGSLQIEDNDDGLKVESSLENEMDSDALEDFEL